MQDTAMPWLTWRTFQRCCIENMSHFLWIQDTELLCSVVFIAVYNKCVILLSKWVTLNAALCTLPRTSRLAVGPPSNLYSGYRGFTGSKASGIWHWPPPTINAMVKGYSCTSDTSHALMGSFTGGLHFDWVIYRLVLHYLKPPDTVVSPWWEKHGYMAPSGVYCAGNHLGARALAPFEHTSHVSDSPFCPRLSQTIFHKLHIWVSYFPFSLVQVTLPHSRRKIKKVCMPVVSASHAFIILSFSAHGILW
jgi:hypothetical protein